MDDLYLAHHGIKGQKWGVRRYQNEDGSLTEAGKKRYLKSDGTLNAKYHQERLRDLDSRLRTSVMTQGNLNTIKSLYEDEADKAIAKGNLEKHKEYLKKARSAEKYEQIEIEHLIDLGREFEMSLLDLDESGYAWKSTPMIRMNNDTTKNGKKYLEENRQMALSGLKSPFNAAIGNDITVKEHASKKQREAYDKQKSIRTYRPARIQVVQN